MAPVLHNKKPMQEKTTERSLGQRSIGLALAILALFSVGAALAQEDGSPPETAPPEVVFLHPSEGQSAFGELDVALRVRAPERSTVELLRNGLIVGRAEGPPFVFPVEFGQENVEHRLEAVLRTPDGSEIRTLLVVPPIQIDDQVELDLQQVYVTVVDGSGERVSGLDRSDFRLIDDQREQEIVTLSQGDVPFTAVLLIDGSESMLGDRWRVAQASARAFLEALGPHDEAKLMVASHRLLLSTPFAHSADELLRPLSRIAPQGDTAIIDHLYLALSLLERRQGRRVVILLSDGWDRQSVLTVDELHRAARLSQALIYWVRRRGDEPNSSSPFVSAWRNVGELKRSYEQLGRIVEASGGRVDRVGLRDDVADRFRDILAELREQYAIGYYPDPRRNDGRWREVAIDVQRSGLQVRARKGYVDR